MLTDQELDIIRERLQKVFPAGKEWERSECLLPDDTPTIRLDVPQGIGYRAAALWLANAPTDIEMLLKHIAELESILRDMQDDALAYREGVKAGLRTAMERVKEYCLSWRGASPVFAGETERLGEMSALTSLLASLEERCKMGDAQ